MLHACISFLGKKIWRLNNSPLKIEYFMLLIAAGMSKFVAKEAEFLKHSMKTY